MPSHRRTQAELEQELREQAAALRASAEGYDAGNLWEAKRLATTAYILLHDGGRNSKSLLGLLGLKGPMLSTADHSEEAPMPLAIVTIDPQAGGKGMSFTPRLSEHLTERKIMPFSKWYKERVFVSGGLRLSRMNLIFALRSQVGGAHVDAEIKDEALQWLRTNSPIHVSSSPPATAKDANGNDVQCPPELDNFFADLHGPVPNGHLASMRQIAWEIEQVLQGLGY